MPLLKLSQKLPKGLLGFGGESRGNTRGQGPGQSGPGPEREAVGETKWHGCRVTSKCVGGESGRQIQQ